MTQPPSPARSRGDVETPKIDWQAELAQHERWLRTVIFARLGEPQAVEDVMQEVALAAVRQRAPIADASKVGPWLYRLAVTQSLLYRRKQGRRRRLVDNYAGRVRPTEADRRQTDPLDWLLADERQAMVRTALGQMVKRDAEILLLKYTQDWSYHDLADHLGISQTALQARLHRARQRLRDNLAALEAERTARPERV
jgi:RNA polymerase sigma factor (sigma-70 family)